MHHQQNFHHHHQPHQLSHSQPQNMKLGSSTSSSKISLKDIVKSLATSTQSFKNETRESIKTLEQKMTQLFILTSR